MEKIDLKDYSIFLGNPAESLSPLLEQYPGATLFVLTDDNTKIHCLPQLEPLLRARTYSVFSIPPGEIHKNINSCIHIWEAMTKAGLDRHAIMINLGGGMIGDMGGFCASTYKRGIRFIQVPTTLLSQVDASIGGKLGIDFAGYKNHIGVFRDPLAVLIHPDFLKTLSDRELKSGYAEVIKHCLIADGGHWQELSGIQNLRATDWTPIIRRSLEVKRKIVHEDPFETGMRKLLNFGHTIGHALESHYLVTNHPLLHGEAIAAGMIYETLLSNRRTGLPSDKKEAVIRYIQSIYGAPPPFDPGILLPVMKQDKKNKDGQISFSLLRDIGDSVWDVMLDEEELILIR